MVKDDSIKKALQLFNLKIDPKSIDNIKLLTKRENQIFKFIGERLTTKEIAKILELSPSTIETHRKNIRRKLKLKGKSNLFEYALLFNLSKIKSDDK